MTSDVLLVIIQNILYKYINTSGLYKCVQGVYKNIQTDSIE